MSRLFSGASILAETLHNINQEKRATEFDDDLIFSFRYGVFGGRLDDDSLMIQLYLGGICVTNPLGAKKDSHNLSMIYFFVEDVPAEYRSKLDYIQLMPICSSIILKANFLLVHVSEECFRCSSRTNVNIC